MLMADDGEVEEVANETVRPRGRGSPFARYTVVPTSPMMLILAEWKSSESVGPFHGRSTISSSAWTLKGANSDTNMLIGAVVTTFVVFVNAELLSKSIRL